MLASSVLKGHFSQITKTVFLNLPLVILCHVYSIHFIYRSFEIFAAGCLATNPIQSTERQNKKKVQGCVHKYAMRQVSYNPKQVFW